MSERLTCEQVFRSLEPYLDRRLTPDRRRLVERHLEECVSCAAEYRFEANLPRDAASQLQRLDVPPDLLERIKGKLLACAVAGFVCLALW